VGEQLAALLTESVEEPLQGGLLPARRGPHQPARVVVDDHRQVSLSALVGDLVDPDSPQVGEPVMHGFHVGPDPGDDRAHGAPGDPHQLRNRALGALGRQPGDLLVEGVGVSGRVPGPRHRGHRRPVLTTADPRSIGFEDCLDRAQVQCSPPPPTLPTVRGRRSPPTPATPATGPFPRTNMSHQQLLVLIELDALDDGLFDPQQGSP
jgi:hypothetical protein